MTTKQQNDNALKPSDNLITLIDPENVASEAFRILRTNISLKDFDEKLKVINVISTAAKESKSTTVLNLAYVFSQLGKKVLVMDLDLRLPSIHKKLKMKNKNGITDVIAKSIDFNEAVIHYTSRMDIILSGTRNPYASELIQSKAFASVLEQLKERYDMIFIDCPPVGLVTDGVITSTLCDGTIMCVATNMNDKRDLEKTRDLLKQFNVNILGIVMTRVPAGKRYYSKYGYKNYGYGYGYYGSS
ncbi:MAG: CpsD/CapB family tyrosine-protein kinase, partial [Erysipelotrichaceae bacterium]|nr:CpsD/CapB family tyrosine-protein kinase [Erysipelotrichaceae bacterium]